MSSAVGARVLTYLGERQPEMTGLLERLVALESPTDRPERQAEMLDLLAEELEAVGQKVRRLSGRASGGHLYARPRARARGRAPQMMVGHCDTVWPVGTLAEMPLSVEDGRMRGPGVYDMKGGLVQILFALRALRELELEPPYTPVVLINSDEESGSDDSDRYIRLLARRSARAFILEPAMGRAGKLKTARKGVGAFTVTVEGVPAHAGLEPEAGASAILELSHVIQKLFALNDPARGVTVNVGVIDGGVRPNMIAPRSRALVDVRVPTMQDAEEIEERIRALEEETATSGVRIRVRGSVDRPPLERTERNRALWRLALAAGAELGLELEEGLAGGGSDGNTTSLYTATLDGLGPVGDGAHARHEFVELDSLVERTALLTLLLVAPPGDEG